MSKIDIKHLFNKVTLILLNDESSKLASVGVFVKFGSRNETNQVSGIAHVIEHMLFKGTLSMTQKEMANTVEGNGGVFNAYTTVDHTCYHIHTLNEFMLDSLRILISMISEPLFDDKDIDIEKKVIIEEIYRDLDDAETLAEQSFNSFLFGNHPLGNPIAGSVNTVTNISKREIVNHHKRNYVGNNICICVSGNINEHNIDDIVNQAVKIKTGRTAKYTKIKKEDIKHSVIKYDEKDCEQGYVFVYGDAPTIYDKLYYPALVANVIFGGNMSSLLFQRLREELGIVYSIGSHIYALDSEEFGIWQISACTSKENIEKCEKEIFSIIENIKNIDINEHDIARAKNFLKGLILLNTSSVSKNMMFIGKKFIREKKLITPEDELAKVMKVTFDDIKEVITKFFSNEKWGIYVFRPLKECPNNLIAVNSG